MKQPTFSHLIEQVAFRKQIEEGNLPIPKELGEVSENTLKFWNALWSNFLNNHGSVSSTYWYDIFKNPKEFNQLLQKLTKLGWINSIVVPGRHWGEVSLNESKILEYIPLKDLIKVRTFKKFTDFQMKFDNKLRANNKTRQNGKISETGLKRPGFAKSGTHVFYYDTNYLAKYYDAIILNTTKSMRKLATKYNMIEDGADYKSVSTEIIDYHLYSPGVPFTLGKNFNDSRGRAISSSLAKVFNPIGYKDARALLIQSPAIEVPNDKIEETKHAVYLFIAELHGIKIIESEQAKANAGKKFYKERDLPTLDLSSEEDRKGLHELIWLERIYAELDLLNINPIDKDFFWTVPIELDASASMIGITGALLNHSPYFEVTNCLTKTGITDPWNIKDLSRLQVKKAGTPLLYGSSQPIKILWAKNELQFTNHEVILMNHEVINGRFKVANDFKDMIIDNVNPLQEMEIHIDDEKFTVQCNRFKRVGDYTKRYPLFDSDSMSMLAIAHTHTHKEADLDQFKRYFQTLLI